MVGFGKPGFEMTGLGLSINPLIPPTGLLGIGLGGCETKGDGLGVLDILGKTLGFAGSTILPMFGVSMDSISCFVGNELELYMYSGAVGVDIPAGGL